MTNANDKVARLKQKFIREMVDYWLNVVYLTVFFGLFTWYRRLVLAELPNEDQIIPEAYSTSRSKSSSRFTS